MASRLWQLARRARLRCLPSGTSCGHNSRPFRLRWTTWLTRWLIRNHWCRNVLPWVRRLLRRPVSWCRWGHWCRICCIGDYNDGFRRRVSNARQGVYSLAVRAQHGSTIDIQAGSHVVTLDYGVRNRHEFRLIRGAIGGMPTGKNVLVSYQVMVPVTIKG